MMDKSKLAPLSSQLLHSAFFLMLLWQLIAIQKSIDYNTRMMVCQQAIMAGVAHNELQKTGCFP